MDRAVGEDDAFVDVMITASQRKGEVILPSHGRVFVPYFMPGASNPGEHDINVNTDVDHFRRGGASFLEAPLPMPLGQEFHGDTGGEQPRTSGRRMGKKRSLVVSSAPKVAGHCNGLPKGAAVTKAFVRKHSHARSSPRRLKCLRLPGRHTRGGSQAARALAWGLSLAVQWTSALLVLHTQYHRRPARFPCPASPRV